MSAPLIRPRRTWIERLTLGFEWALVALGLLGLAGWLIPIEPLVQPVRDAAPFGVDTALCALALGACLLYTSDAADDLLCVDPGGRRIIKKKK